jgi:hypothetical protein
MAHTTHCLHRIFGFLLITTGLPLLAVAQAQLNSVTCNASNQRGALLVTVQAKQSSPPGTVPGLHLVVAPLPSEAQIVVSDQRLKAAIRAWVDSQNSLDPAQRHDWILDGKNSANLFNSQDALGLRKALEPTFTISFAALKQPQAGGLAQPQTVNFCFASTAPPATVKALEILVSTTPLLRGPAAGTSRIPLASPGDGVTANALLIDRDFSNEGEKTRLLNALGAVAKSALEVARKEGLATGSAPSDALQRRVEIKVLELYNMKSGTLPGFAWPDVDVHIEFTPGTGDFVLRIGGVRMAKSASIEVDLGITPGTEKGTRKAKALALKTEEELNRRFAARLKALTNTVPTFAQIDSLSADIALAPEIIPSSLPVSIDDDQHPQQIAFNTKNRWIGFGFKLSASGGYSPEEKAAGTLTFEGDNLLLKLPDNLRDRPRETESLSYKGGNEVQKVNGSWAIDWTHDPEDSTRPVYGYGIHFSADYLQDSDQRFGNLQGPHLRDRERGVKASGVYSFHSRLANDKEDLLSQTYGVSAAAGLEYRRVNVDPSSPGVVLPLATGAMTAAFLDLTLNYRYEPVNRKGGGIGGLELTVTSHAIHSFSVSDFAFTQVLVSGQGTLFFGPTHPRDFFLRFRQGLGASNGGTPLFELFRLGGADVLRGIEQGEFVGRKIAYQQFEAGISVRQILSWFSAKSKVPPKSEEEAVKPPVDLSKFYLKGFYDRGQVSKSASFSDLVAFRHAPKGYGFAFEIQALPAAGKRITLSIGYARSPDSVLHRSGLAITGVSINF